MLIKFTRRLTYDKIYYVQYTDGTFTAPAQGPDWTGMLRPILGGVVG